ncbi:MAG: GAF domain-containing protein, partial [Pseudomonadota bacterium]
MIYLSYLSLLSAAASLALGLLVLAKDRRRMEGKLFVLTMVTLAAVELGHFLVLRVPRAEYALLLMRISEAATCLLPAALYSFSLIAARADSKQVLRRRWLPTALFVVGSLFFAPLAFHHQFLSGPVSLDDLPIFPLGRWGQYFYVFFLVACAATLVNLEAVLRSSEGSRRSQVKYGLLGLGGILIGFIFVISQNLVYRVLRVDYIPVASAAVLLSLVPLSYGVVRDRFLEVDVFVSRYVIYNSLAAVALGAYLVAMGLLVRLMGYLGLEYSVFWKFFLVFASGMALAVVLLSPEVRNRVKLFIARHFYKNKYDYRLQWIALSQRLGSSRSREEIGETVVEMLAETMFVREVGLWLCDDDGGAFSLRAFRGIPAADDRISARSGILSCLAAKGRTMRVRELEEEVPLAWSEHLGLFEHKLKAVLATPLLAGKRLLGFITVGPESTGCDFVEDDMDLLDSVATQAAAALLGTYLSASLVKAQEEQLFHRLASFVIHDLKNVISMLSLVVHNAQEHIADPEFQKDVLATIRVTVDRMKALSGRLAEARQQRMEVHKAPLRLDELARERVEGFLAGRAAAVTLDAASPVAV